MILKGHRRVDEAGPIRYTVHQLWASAYVSGEAEDSLSRRIGDLLHHLSNSLAWFDATRPPNLHSDYFVIACRGIHAGVGRVPRYGIAASARVVAFKLFDKNPVLLVPDVDMAI